MNDSIILSPRPYSVSLLLCALVLCFLAGLPRLTASLAASEPRGLLLLPYLVFVSATFWTVSKRREVGRKLALVFLGLVFVLALYFVFNQPDYQARPEMLRPSSPAQRGGALLSRVMLPPLIVVWFWRLGYSRRSKEYFRSVEPPSNTTETLH
jgi:hypothetical protein